MYDPATSAEAVARAIEAAGGTVLEADDPTLLPRAIKNATEIAGSRAAHIRDGAALRQVSCTGSMSRDQAAP